jgi:predicted transcriptional regulator
VYDEGILHGFMTIREMAFVPRKKWGTTTVSQVMIPISQKTVANADQLASDILDRMNVNEINYIPVLDGKRVVGIIVRDEIIRYHRIRSDLKI